MSLLVVALMVSLLAFEECQARPTPHQEALELHQNRAPFDFPNLEILTQDGAAEPRAVRVVYGYYPYWVSAWDYVRWDLLTHIAYFAIEMNSDGSLGARHGWPDTDFVETAHLFGVKVDVTFTLFSGSGIQTLCGSDENRARGIGNMIDMMEAGGADGINVDFEGLSRGTRDCFTQYIRELRETLTARGHTAAGIGIAGPAVDWTNEFDLLELSEYVNVFFIMGYGYHWTRSPKAGPVGQLRVTESWRPHISISMQRTLAHYTSLVPSDRRRAIVFGVPYYGREWPTEGPDLHDPATADGSSRTYAVARRAIENGRMRRYDPDSQNPWYRYQSAGVWRQAWFDDAESLTAKYRLALEQDIGGVGMWALGYDGEYPELWDVLDAHFTEEPVPVEGTRERPIPIDELPADFTGDTRSAPSNYFNRYSCAPDLPEYGREFVYGFDTCRPGTLTVTVEDELGVDVDVHLLSGDDETSCITRDDRELVADIDQGRFRIVADSYVSDHVPQEGPFSLTVDFQPDPNAPGCGPRERCFEGRCVDESVTLRPSVDAEARPDTRIDPTYQPPAVDPTQTKDATFAEDSGCGCSATHTNDDAPFGLLLVIAAIRRRKLH